MHIKLLENHQIILSLDLGVKFQGLDVFPGEAAINHQLSASDVGGGI